MSKKKTFFKVIIPVFIIIAGVIIMQTLISSRHEPRKETRNFPGILVQTFSAEKTDTKVIVKGTGTVESAQEISVIPQVSGRVIYIAPHLNVGGFFKTGEILFEIEDTDYRLALDQAMSAKAKAEYELATIESQAKIARDEWALINNDDLTPPNPLVLYEPQLKNAQASQASAEAAVKQAKLNLERTKIKADFNSRVRSENIDLGQYVRAGTSVAVLAGTDTAEIIVPLPLDELQWIEIPAHGKSVKGPVASVELNINGKSFTWNGNVVRSTGEVDVRTRMIQLVVEVDDPYGLESNKILNKPALATGTFVDVQIHGMALKGVYTIPRTSFRDNSTVWIMDKEYKLMIREVTPVRIEKDEVIISHGLDDGNEIILTNIAGAANGMKLRKNKK